MSKKPEMIKKIMEKFKLVKPVSREMQDMILARKKSDFKKILKRSGEYSILTGLAAWLFFALKKLGISISYVKSMVLSAIIALTVTASVATGGYLVTVKYIIPQFKEEIPEQTKPDEKTRPEKQKSNKEAVNVKKKIDIQEHVAKEAQKIIALKPFTAGNENRELATTINKKIAAIIKGNNKKIALINYGQKMRNKPGLILLGTIDKLDKMIIINAKLVDGKSSKIIFYDSVTAQSEADLDRACEKIARAVAGKVL